jgi:hypothetical protein
MKPALFFFFFLSLASAFGARLTSRIHSLDVARKVGDSHLVMLENGSVVFLKYEDKKNLRRFKTYLKKNESLDIKVDAANNVLAVETLSSPEIQGQGPEFSFPQTYEPSVLGPSEATEIFRRMRRDYQNDSQCYNRAHIWTWEEFRKSGLRSRKHFLFFTRRYIRNYRYKWWFHVSPSVLVQGLGDRILDRRYTGGPRSLNSWTSIFIASRRSCPVVNNYFDYRNNQESQDCYLIPVSMYFWQPRDIERRDLTGFVKTSYIQREVNYAYWEAF